MAKLNTLEEEIKAMEEGLFSTPVEKETAAEKVVAPVDTDETQDITPAPEVKVETVDNTISQEGDLSTADESAAKQKRTNWKKRFVNLKASHDGTVSQLRVDLSRTVATNAKLENAIIDLQSELESLKNSSVDIYKDAFSADEVDILGEDTISSMKKATKIAVDSAVSPLKEQLNAERTLRVEALERESANQATQANSVFLERLGNVVPDYLELDTNPNFLTYMNQPDEFSGTARKDLFKQAQGVGDVGRVASFFNEFKKTLNPGNALLESKVTPDSVVDTSPKTDTTVELISREFIDKFYSDATKGKYRGREKERQDIERKIDLAVMEGRIN